MPPSSPAGQVAIERFMGRKLLGVNKGVAGRNEPIVPGTMATFNIEGTLRHKAGHAKWTAKDINDHMMTRPDIYERVIKGVDGAEKSGWRVRVCIASLTFFFQV